MPSILITGTSTGIGLATSLRFARAGYRTFATMRDLAKAAPLREARESEGLDLELLRLDVTDPASIAAAFAAVLPRGLDALVNNAGWAGGAPLELVDEDLHRGMFEANYFGAIRMIQAALPHMRERRSGTIVNVTSIAGRVAMPNQVPYTATKWALEGASEALAHEVRRFGIRVRIIEPGVIMTSIFENAKGQTIFDRSSPYVDLMRRNGKFYSAGHRANQPPELVADAIFDAVESDEDRLRYVVGADAQSILRGRTAMRDEEWVAMGDDLSDDAYNAEFRARFGIDLRQPG
ncbi:MAG: SDR family oxidoreductase [Immundisolibacterales bacterium]|nr:SDR family oxidoreductase [Immundisolibacterales bacterium]